MALEFHVFFWISGFLFYYKFDWNKIIDKFKRRFFTLIIPFIIWNTITYIFYLIIYRIDIFKMEPLIFTIRDYSIAIFNSTYSPLWFVYSYFGSIYSYFSYNYFYVEE